MAVTTETVRIDTEIAKDTSATYVAPGEAGSLVSVKPRYGNCIGGEFVAPGQGPVHARTRRP